jgi:hypothetical protein
MKPLHAILNVFTGRIRIKVEARVEICNHVEFANAGEDELHRYKKTMSCRGEPCVHPATKPARTLKPVNPLARVSAIFLLSSFAFAQTATGVNPVNVASKTDLALPLVSIGSSVGWKIGAEDYRLNVAQILGNASLEVFSPEINLNDYANKTDRKNYYGDELYAKNAKLETTFKLANSANLQLVNKKFGSSLKHSFVQLFSGSLNAGFYPMCKVLAMARIHFRFVPVKACGSKPASLRSMFVGSSGKINWWRTLTLVRMLLGRKSRSRITMRTVKKKWF